MMTIEVKLFANLRPYLPKDSNGKSTMLELEPGTTIQAVIDRFEIPAPLTQLVMIDGRHVTDFSTSLNEPCTLSIFPPIAGG